MKASIVTPSFGQARFIAATLESVAAQAGAPWEHVVFDGGSTDGTAGILERFRPPVRWVSEKDRGQAHAVNKGIAATEGEVIGWLNSDDLYVPGAVARAVSFLESHPHVDVVYGQADHIDAEGRVLGPYPTEPWDPRRLKEACFLCQPAVFFRRRVVEAHGPLDESLRYCMDYEFWLRLALRGVRFAYLEEKLALSRLHAETKTLGSRVPVHAEINDMLRRTLGKVPNRWLAHYAFAVADGHGAAGRGPGARRLRAVGPFLAAAWRWNRPFAPRGDG